MPYLDQENFCMNELMTWLRANAPTTRVRCDRGSDPPDFWLWRNDMQFAVEVTQVTHEEDRRIVSSQWSMVNEAESAARAAGTLTGCYIVDLHEPMANNRERAKAKSLILKHVAATRALVSTEYHAIRVGQRVVCRIRKEHDQINALCPLGGGTNTGGYVDDVIAELTNILRDRIGSKKMKLSELEHPAILVLHDQYSFAEPELFTECVRSVSEHSFFDSIYVVVSRGNGFMLTKTEQS